MSDKQFYKCNYPVRHNGKQHTDSIELAQDEAKPLLKVGAITPADKSEAATKEEAPKVEAKEKPDEEQQEIKLEQPETKPQPKSKKAKGNK